MNAQTMKRILSCILLAAMFIVPTLAQQKRVIRGSTWFETNVSKKTNAAGVVSALGLTNIIAVVGSTNLTDSSTNVLALGGVLASALVATNGVTAGTLTTADHAISDGGTNLIKLQSNAITIGAAGLTAFALPNSARGMLVISNSAMTQVFGTTPSRITNYVSAWSGNRHIGGSITNGTMVLTNAGVYLLNFGMTFSTSAVDTYTGEIYLDEVGTGIRFQKLTGAVADTEVLRIMGLASVTAGQTLSMRVNVAAATATVTLRCATLNAIQQPD